MNIFGQLAEKPWMHVDRENLVDIDESATESAAPMGLRVYFAVACVMFGLIIAAYLMRMGLVQTSDGYDWRSMPKPSLLWVNTGLLFASSFYFQRARNASRRDQMKRVANALLAAGFFSFAFLAGQLVVWNQLIAAGYFLGSNPANSFFYMITTFHGVHLLGGLIAWARTVTKVWDGVEPAQVRLSVQLCTTYWHFLLVVWLVFYYLLLST